MSDPPEPVTKPSEGRGRVSGSKKITKPSPTKSVKSKSLVASKVSNSSKSASRSSNSKMNVEKKTPKKNGSGSKACSTPTNTEDTISDMTLDASCITAVKSTGSMDDTVKSSSNLDRTMKAPVLRMKSVTAVKPSRINQTLKNRTMIPPGRTAGTGKKTLKAAVKEEALETDPEEVTDDMLESAYYRYLQAKFIAMKSKEARKKAEEDARNQILQAFFATEALRMEVQKKSLEKVLNDSLASMRRSLVIVEEKLIPVLQVLKHQVQDKVGSVATSLEGINDNLVVQGLTLGEQNDTTKEMEKLKEIFEKFNEDMSSYRDIATAGGEELEEISKSFKELSEDYSKIVELTENVKMLLKQTESLAIKEASLAISFRDIGVNIEQ